MRKRIVFVVLLAVFSGTFLQAQEKADKHKDMSWGIDIYHDIWQGLPEDMETHTILPGFNAFALYNFQIGKSAFDFSAGLSLGTHNLKNNTLLTPDTNGISTFKLIPDSVSYKKSKLALTYWDIPLEVKYQSKNGILIGLGFKYGFLLKAQTKYKGDNPATEAADMLTTKQSGLPNFESNRYGVTFRAGYKKVSLFGYYSLSRVFTPGRGPEMFPISVGITFFPY